MSKYLRFKRLQAARAGREFSAFVRSHLPGSMLAIFAAFLGTPIASVRAGVSMSEELWILFAQGVTGVLALIVLAFVFYWIVAPHRMYFDEGGNSKNAQIRDTTAEVQDPADVAQAKRALMRFIDSDALPAVVALENAVRVAANIVSQCIYGKTEIRRVVAAGIRFYADVQKPNWEYLSDPSVVRNVQLHDVEKQFENNCIRYRVGKHTLAKMLEHITNETPGHISDEMRNAINDWLEEDKKYQSGFLYLQKYPELQKIRSLNYEKIIDDPRASSNSIGQMVNHL